MLAHWWLELYLVSLVGRAYQGVCLESCGLRTILGSLSADGWGCVPTILVVWPEAFQH